MFPVRAVAATTGNAGPAAFGAAPADLLAGPCRPPEIRAQSQQEWNEQPEPTPAGRGGSPAQVSCRGGSGGSGDGWTRTRHPDVDRRFRWRRLAVEHIVHSAIAAMPVDHGTPGVHDSRQGEWQRQCHLRPFSSRSRRAHRVRRQWWRSIARTWRIAAARPDRAGPAARALEDTHMSIGAHPRRLRFESRSARATTGDGTRAAIHSGQ